MGEMKRQTERQASVCIQKPFCLQEDRGAYTEIGAAEDILTLPFHSF